jgi:hypothetical protein
MVAEIEEDFRYSLFGLVIGLQNKDLPLVTENLLKVRSAVCRILLGVMSSVLDSFFGK